jgi:hypothetical protein
MRFLRKLWAAITIFMNAAKNDETVRKVLEAEATATDVTVQLKEWPQKPLGNMELMKGSTVECSHDEDGYTSITVHHVDVKKIARELDLPMEKLEKANCLTVKLNLFFGLKITFFGDKIN